MIHINIPSDSEGELANTSGGKETGGISFGNMGIIYTKNKRVIIHTYKLDIGLLIQSYI